MTDIVERLREPSIANWTPVDEVDTERAEAADEIERLRGEYRIMRSYANHRFDCTYPTRQPCSCGYSELFKAGLT